MTALKKPREFWIDPYNEEVWQVECVDMVHVREVLDPDPRDAMIVELLNKVDFLEAQLVHGIHTCSPKCRKVECEQRRKISELEKLLGGIEERFFQISKAICVSQGLNTKLRDLIRKKDEALKLYASKKNWNLSASLGVKKTCALFNGWGEALDDLEIFKERNITGIEGVDFFEIYYPGKRAREALALKEDT